MSAQDADHGGPPRGEPDAREAATALSADTRLADVIAGNPNAVGVLAALHPLFGRLDDAEARKSMGHLVTLGDAAVIAGVPLAQILAALGASAALECAGASDSPDGGAPPAWIESFEDDDAVVIDVRPILASGRDPFNEVMTVAKPIPSGGDLVIHAPFNPPPLRRVLGQMGFETFGDETGESHFRVRCRRMTSGASSGGDERTMFGARVWSEGDGVHIDVRGMTAPGPLTAILSLIDSDEHAGILVVHHEREPVYLFPELVERRWTAEQVAGEPGEVRFMLRQEDR